VVARWGTRKWRRKWGDNNIGNAGS